MRRKFHEFTRMKVLPCVQDDSRHGVKMNCLLTFVLIREIRVKENALVCAIRVL